MKGKKKSVKKKKGVTVKKKSVKKGVLKSVPKSVKKSVKTSKRMSTGRGKKNEPDTEAALQRELKREKAEGKGVVGDMGKNRNLSGSSTWETLKPPRSREGKSAVQPANSSTPSATDARADIARVAGQLADRLRHRGVRLFGQEKPAELAELMDAVERFEAMVENRGGDLMVDEPTKPGAPVSPDQRDFVLPERRDNESVAELITRISQAVAVAAKHER